MNQETIGVLGGTGFVGRHLIKRLLDAGHEVHCVDVIAFQDVIHLSIENAIRVSVMLVDHRLHAFSTRTLQVGIGHHLHVGIRQESRENV